MQYDYKAAAERYKQAAKKTATSTNSKQPQDSQLFQQPDDTPSQKKGLFGRAYEFSQKQRTWQSALLGPLASPFVRETVASGPAALAKTTVQLPKAMVAGTAGLMGNEEMEADWSKPTKTNIPFIGDIKGLSAVPGHSEKYGTQTAGETAMQAIDIASTIPSVPAVKNALKARKEVKAIKEAAEKADDLAQYVMPQMNKNTSISAIKKGTKGVEEAGIASKAAFKPSKKELEIVDSVREVVDPKLSHLENIDRLNANITNIAENQVTPFLKQNGAIYNKNLLKNTFNKMKKNKLGFLKTDEQSAKIYDSVIDEALNIANKQKTKDMHGLWRSRIEFDGWVDKNFGDKVLASDTARSARDEAIKRVREGMNDFIASHTPDQTFKKLMKDLSNNYSAIDNIAGRGYAEGITKMSKLKKFAKDHPYVTKGAEWSAVGAVGTGAVGLVKDAAN